MQLRRTRSNVFTLNLTGQELSALIAAARMSFDAMRGEPEAPREAVELLGRLLNDYETALGRLGNENGR